MENTEFLRSLIGLLGVPVITGLIQAIKPFVKDTRLYPFIAMGLGLIINISVALALSQYGGLALTVAVFQGIMGGLSASGLYDIVKK